MQVDFFFSISVHVLLLLRLILQPAYVAALQNVKVNPGPHRRQRGPVQLNNSVSLSNLCSIIVSRREELNYNQIGCHAVIQMRLESTLTY